MEKPHSIKEPVFQLFKGFDWGIDVKPESQKGTDKGDFVLKQTFKLVEIGHRITIEYTDFIYHVQDKSVALFLDALAEWMTKPFKMSELKPSFFQWSKKNTVYYLISGHCKSSTRQELVKMFENDEPITMQLLFSDFEAIENLNAKVNEKGEIVDSNWVVSLSNHYVERKKTPNPLDDLCCLDK